MTRDEWLRSFSQEQRANVIRRGELVLPCGPDRGCDIPNCQGWLVRNDIEFDEWHPWTPEEIAEARRYRDSAAAPSNL